MAKKLSLPKQNAETRDEKGRFLPGNSGFGGRPKGSRNKFAQQFVDDFHQVWQEEGINALRNAARRSPARFIQVAASLIPQHFKFEHEHKLGVLSDAELKQKVLEAQEELKRAGITIDLEAEELPALPAPELPVKGTDGTRHRRNVPKKTKAG